MAEVSFFVNFYFDSKGKEWAEIPEETLKLLIYTCQDNILLEFEGKSFSPILVDISEVDTYSEMPNELKDQLFDAFARIYITYDIDNSIVEDLELDSDSEEYNDDIDSILGEGVYQVKSWLPISRPNSLQIFL